MTMELPPDEPALQSPVDSNGERFKLKKPLSKPLPPTEERLTCISKHGASGLQRATVHQALQPQDRRWPLHRWTEMR